MKSADIYLIDCLSHLHAGSGDEAYGIIDNRVQRDPATGYPCIFSSSLKGAIREFFDKHAGAQQLIEQGLNGRKSKADYITDIFGSQPGERVNTKPGTFVFMGAQLLSMPVRSNVRSYFNTTNVDLLQDFITFAKQLGNPGQALDSLNKLCVSGIDKPTIYLSNVNSPILEDVPAEMSNDSLVAEDLKKYIGGFPAVLPGHISLLKDVLPVIARNQLDSGISKNLWYEEVVPRFSRFYFAVGYGMQSTAESRNLDAELFASVLQSHVLQIGGNATIGYGYCKIQKLEL